MNKPEKSPFARDLGSKVSTLADLLTKRSSFDEVLNKRSTLADLLTKRSSFDEVLNKRSTLADLLTKRSSFDEVLNKRSTLADLLTKRSSFDELLNKRSTLADLLTKRSSFDELLNKRSTLADLLTKRSSFDELLSKRSTLADLLNRNTGLDASGLGRGEISSLNLGQAAYYQNTLASLKRLSERATQLAQSLEPAETEAQHTERYSASPQELDEQEIADVHEELINSGIVEADGLCISDITVGRLLDRTEHHANPKIRHALIHIIFTLIMELFGTFHSFETTDFPPPQIYFTELTTPQLQCDTTFERDTKAIANFYRIVKAERLNVEKRETKRSTIVGQLNEAQVVRIVKKNKDWTCVEWKDKSSDTLLQGWVYTRYLLALE